MSELDLGLKVASRRLLWRMGYTTRLDVQLRGVWGPGRPDRASERARRGAQPESFTDLDVLGLGFAGGSRLHSAIVDCKTSPGGSTGRMFWVRGVADFFAADDAYMVRDSVVSDAARQLTTRLGITALTSDDLGRLEALHPSELPLDTAPLSQLGGLNHCWTTATSGTGSTTSTATPCSSSSICGNAPAGWMPVTPATSHWCWT